MEHQKATVNNEIDFIELIRILWTGRKWIILSGLIVTLIAGSYAFLAKEKWTSTAEVIEPKILDLGNYLSLRREYAQIMRETIPVSDVSKELFSKFDRLLYSLDNRSKFFEQSDEYKKLSEEKDETSKKKILYQLATEHVSIEKPDSKKNPDLLGKRVSLSASTADSSQETLAQFIQFTSKEAVSLDSIEFKQNISNQITSLEYEVNVIEQDLSTIKKVQLDNLSKAYDIAREAGVKEYRNVDSSKATSTSEAQVSLSESKIADSPYLFMLGEKYLKAQIDTINNSKLIYPSKYYLMVSQLNQLKRLLSKFDTIDARSYSYLSSPSYPIKRDWPKRAILILIGGGIGGIMGCLVVLGRAIFLSRKK